MVLIQLVAAPGDIWVMVVKGKIIVQSLTVKTKVKEAEVLAGLFPLVQHVVVVELDYMVRECLG
jgi:hypothetical protein